LRRGTWRYVRMLWLRSWTERRWGRPRHRGRRRGTDHHGRSRRSGRWCRWREPPLLLGISHGARRYHGDAKKKRCKATARRQHGGGALITC
jgi:hypothetical protein